MGLEREKRSEVDWRFRKPYCRRAAGHFVGPGVGQKAEQIRRSSASDIGKGVAFETDSSSKHNDPDGKVAGRSVAEREGNLKRNEGAFHPWEQEALFTIESKRFSISRSKHGLIQLCEESRKKKFRFWVDSESLHWIRRSFESIPPRSLQIYSQVRSLPGNRRLSFSYSCNSVGFFVRLTEIRDEGTTTIVVPEGIAGFGFRLFTANLKSFCSSFKTLSNQEFTDDLCPRIQIDQAGGFCPVQMLSCPLPSKAEYCTVEYSSPSELLFHLELKRGGWELESGERRRQKELLKRMAEAKGWLLRLLKDTNGQPSDEEPMDSAASFSITKGRESAPLVAPADCSMEKSAAGSHITTSRTKYHQNLTTGNGQGHLQSSSMLKAESFLQSKPESTLMEVIYEENGILYVKTVNRVVDESPVPNANSPKLLGQSMSNLSNYAEGKRNTRIEKEENEARTGAQGSNDGLNAFKRIASTGLKHMLNTGRKAAAGYNRFIQNANSAHNRAWDLGTKEFEGLATDKSQAYTPVLSHTAATSKLNINAVPFEPMTPLMDDSAYIAPEDLHEAIVLEELRRAEKGKGILIEEVETGDGIVDDPVNDTIDYELHLRDDFKIDKGGKGHKPRKSKRKKKR